MVRNEVVTAVAGVPRAVGAAGAAARVEITAAEEAEAAPVVPAIVATAAVEDLLAAVGNATGGDTLRRSAPRRRATSSPSVLGAWVLTTRRVQARRTRRCWQWNADVRRRSRRGSPGVRAEGNRQVQRDGRGRNRGGELGKQVVQYVADSAATCNRTSDADGLTNYRECSRPLGFANGETASIAGYGNVAVAFRSDKEWVHVKLQDVAHAPLLSYNLISLPSLALKCHHTYAGDKNEATLELKGGNTVRFPLIGKLYRQCRYRPEAKGGVVDTACAVIASGQAKSPPSPTDINNFHCTYIHTHEVLLKKTAEQQGVNLSGELHKCRVCSMAKGLRKTIARSTHTI